MLKVQEALRSGKTLEDLAAEIGIKANRHESLPLVILNYDQLDSPKTHPIVRECRGLTLEVGTWNVVAKSFNRFFNWGEVADEMPLFDFSDFIVQSKEDGSLVLIYYCRQARRWMANTRGSFAQDLLPFQTFTWQEGFAKALGTPIQQLDLDPEFTYVCEFCSPWNKVVRRYEHPVMFLLTAFHEDHEVHWTTLGRIAMNTPFQRPKMYEFRTVEEIQEFLRKQAETDPTFEGVVIRDGHGHRWKIKSATYLGLHRLGSNKECLFNPSNLLPFIMAGESDELLTYFPEVREHYEKLKAQVDEHFAKLEVIWATHKGVHEQKDFALAIKGLTPFTGLLFNMRKLGATDLKAEWRKSEHLILKQLKV